MPRITPSIRITIGLVLFTVSALLIGDLLGIVPDKNASLLDARKKISESLAVQFSSALSRRDVDSVIASLQTLVERNPDILSAGIRTADGKLLTSSDEHNSLWEVDASDRSSETHVLIPLFSGKERWGRVEILFNSPWSSDFWNSFRSSLPALILFLAVSGFIGYFLLIRKSLKHLDPATVIPERVKAAFDSLTEGVLILDEDENILLSNISFTNASQRQSEELLGRPASSLDWATDRTEDSSLILPWSKEMDLRETRKGIPLALKTPSGIKTFNVNVSPILDENDKRRGALATFDDMTLLERKNSELMQTLDDLKTSKQQIQEKNTELEFIAAHDALTGCLNRRSFFGSFETAFTAALEDEQPLSCIMTDIDHFKLVNDNFGHATGDRVIKVFSGILRSHSRPDDVVGRYGGEEFCIFLPGMEEVSAVEIAERLRLEIESCNEIDPESGVRITASFGVSSLSSNPDNPEQLVDQADRALYRAKENGRNQVSLFTLNEDFTAAESLAPQTGSTNVVELPAPISQGESDHRRSREDTDDSDKVLHLKQRIKELEQTVAERSEELDYQAVHDPLTGLPNRALFFDRLQQAINRGGRSQENVAILLFNVGAFNRINSTLGPIVGDQLLKKISKRLIGTIRNMDTLAAMNEQKVNPMISRLGSNEFGILLTGLENAKSVTWIVTRIIESLTKVFHLGAREYYFTTDVGITLYPQDGQSPNLLIKNAVKAKEHAQESQGENRFYFYSDDLNRSSSYSIQLESELHAALESDQFLLHYQPKVDTDSGTVAGMEALIRWQHPQRGMVPPDKFIPIAENSGLIHSIGHWVLREACAQGRAWLDQGLAIGRIAVNLSALQLLRTDIVDKILEIVGNSGFPFSNLELELTESAIIDNFESTTNKLNLLRDKGVGIAIDDFGTGYSSLSYLKQLPVDILKIDRSFINSLETNKQDTAIISSIINLAHNLDLKVTAEGVETAGQREMMQQMRCDQIQGYFISRPLPAEEANRFFEKWNEEHLNLGKRATSTL